MAIKAETTFSLADQLFNADSVTTLAKALTNAWDGFDQKKFIGDRTYKLGSSTTSEYGRYVKSLGGAP